MSDDYLSELLDELVTAEPQPAWNDVLTRARRSRRRSMTAVAALAVLVLAPSAWAIHNALATKHYRPSYAPSALQFVDLSWLSQEHGLALVGRSCGRDRTRCAVVEETTDAGSTWHQLASLPAMIGAGSNGASSTYGACATGQTCVAHIRFVTARIAYAYGPSLLMTTDGGRRWAEVSAPPVESLTNSGAQVFRIVYSHTGCPGPCRARMQRAEAGASTWVRMPVAVPVNSGTGPTLYAAGPNLYAFSWDNVAGGVSSRAEIEVSRDGGRGWSAITDPCRTSRRSAWDAAAASAAGDSLAVLCVSKIGGSSFVALSGDSGRTFTKTADLGMAAADQIAVSSSGAVAVGNGGVTGGGAFAYKLAVSRDGGRTWRLPVVDRERAAIDLSGGFLQFASRRQLLWVGYPYSLWRSADQGRTWHETPLTRP